MFLNEENTFAWWFVVRWQSRGHKVPEHKGETVVNTLAESTIDTDWLLTATKSSRRKTRPADWSLAEVERFRGNFSSDEREKQASKGHTAVVTMESHEGHEAQSQSRLGSRRTLQAERRRHATPNSKAEPRKMVDAEPAFSLAAARRSGIRARVIVRRKRATPRAGKLLITSGAAAPLSNKSRLLPEFENL